MAFSIFNKSGDGKPATQDATKTSVKSPKDASKKADEGGESTFPSAVTASLVSRPTNPVPSNNAPEMMAYDMEEINPFQEVAILYASDYLDVAQNLLRDAVADKNSGPQPWLMLLDLYKFRSLKNEFEEVAMNYTVKFEKSPPTWNEQSNQLEARKESRQNSDFFSFQSKEGLISEINKLVDFVNKLGSARIDVGRIKVITVEEAELFAKILLDLRKRKISIRFNNVNSFTDLLKKTIAENLSKEFSSLWVLLFELYQRLGMQNEFEDLGLEYAMGFEMSPPSWEPIALEEETSTNETEAESTNETPSSQGFPLRGAIGLDNLTQIQQMMNHAAAHKEVHINMSGLQRIDFAAVGNFVDALNKLATAGKKVVLIDVGELIFPLFEAFAINRLAVMLRQKAQ